MSKRFIIALAALAALGAPGVARADAVTDWNLHTSNALFVTAGQPPNVSTLHVAMVQGAVYDAVNAIGGAREGYLLTSRVAQPMDSKPAAAATAAYKVLLHLVPAQKPALDAHYAASLAAIPNGSSKTRGIAVGEAAAAAMIAARTDDGRFGAFRFVTGSGPGVWKPVLPSFGSDPNAWVKDVRPFLMGRASQFRSDGPYPLHSAEYTREFNEVKSVGSLNSTTRTPDQTHAARYWNENPPATWSRILRSISASRGLSIDDNARLYAEAWLTAADAFIAVWDEKAVWSNWRPITAIREADTDGNPNTHPDFAWLPLIPTPPYPDHPSGHLGLSGSIVQTLRAFFATDAISWTDTNGAGLTRSYSSLSATLQEIVDVRVWSGIHFRNADEASVKIAQGINRWRLQHYFRPTGGPGGPLGGFGGFGG
jgi:hypothetical protein